jgi:hypothetical protein
VTSTTYDQRIVYDFRSMSHETAAAMMDLARLCRSLLASGSPDGYAVAAAFTRLADAMHVPASAYGVLREVNHDGI